MIGGLQDVYYNVKNMKLSVSFYENILGFKKVQLKGTNYGRRSHQDDIFPGWMDELGDTLFSLIALANTNDIQLETGGVVLAHLNFFWTLIFKNK